MFCLVFPLSFFCLQMVKQQFILQWQSHSYIHSLLLFFVCMHWACEHFIWNDNGSITISMCVRVRLCASVLLHGFKVKTLIQYIIAHKSCPPWSILEHAARTHFFDQNKWRSNICIEFQFVNANQLDSKPLLC